MSEPQPCQVLVDGAWVSGELLGWTRRDRQGQWWGLVRYTVDRWKRYEQARPGARDSPGCMYRAPLIQSDAGVQQATPRDRGAGVPHRQDGGGRVGFDGVCEFGGGGGDAANGAGAGR